jgi:hypothetical protein
LTRPIAALGDAGLRIGGAAPLSSAYLRLGQKQSRHRNHHQARNNNHNRSFVHWKLLSLVP